jgi:hypothetical protein
MESERYRPPTPEQWKEDILADVDRIKKMPDSILEKGPIYEVETKTGEKLRCETYQLDLNEAVRVGIEGIKNPHVGDERLYLIAVNTSDQIIGTRFTTLFFHEDKIEASSLIKVLQKGKGYAHPIDEVFQLQLQSVADIENKSVVWRVSNKNLANLEDYERGENVDPAALQEMREEQERWQTRYGTGNKLGIDKNRKVFTPRSSTKT